jgi:hypothetical protein
MNTDKAEQETGEGNAPREKVGDPISAAIIEATNQQLDCVIAQHNDAMTTANKYKRERDQYKARAERLAEALRRIQRRIDGADGSNQPAIATIETIDGWIADALAQWEEGQ